MLSLTTLQKILTKKEISDDYFLQLHFCVEAVIRRLFFIGLRVKGVQYRIAQEFVQECPPGGLRNHIPLVLGFCEVDYNELKKSGNYYDLETLFFEFARCYRNRRVHGLSLAITDTELLKLLIAIDKSYVNELMRTLKNLGKPSLFDNPGKWGAKRQQKKDIPVELQKLFKRRSEAPMPREKAEKMLKEAHVYPLKG